MRSAHSLRRGEYLLNIGQLERKWSERDREALLLFGSGLIGEPDCDSSRVALDSRATDS